MTKLPLLYKRTKTGAIQQWTIVVEDGTFHSEEGQVGGAITINKPTVCLGKNPGKANETTPAQQAAKEALAKWKKKCEKGYTTDINEIDNQVSASGAGECMLAEKYKDMRPKKHFVFPVISDRKYNGMRCKSVESGQWTRNNKPIVACPHIRAGIEHLFAQHQGLFIDGELFNHDLGKGKLNQLLSLCRKQKPTPEQLAQSEAYVQYYVYDGYNVNGLGKDAPFSERKAALKEILKDIPYIVVMDHDYANNQEELDAYYHQYMEEGYEGQMVRFDIGYDDASTRSKYLIKRKSFVDAEFEILGAEEGIGNSVGAAVKLICRLPNGETFNPTMTGTLEYRKEIWQTIDKYIGKLATVKYFELTEFGVPQHPNVIQIDRMDI